MINRLVSRRLMLLSIVTGRRHDNRMENGTEYRCMKPGEESLLKASPLEQTIALNELSHFLHRNFKSNFYLVANLCNLRSKKKLILCCNKIRPPSSKLLVEALNYPITVYCQILNWAF